MTNRPISIKTNSLTPEFIKRDGPLFAKFIQYYFEWLEENGAAKNFRQYQDIDIVGDQFLEFIKNEFLMYLHETLMVDKRKLIKNIKDFYLAKGDENSIRLLFRILFDEEISFYYPKVDIFRLSYAKWVVEESIKIINYDNTVNPTQFDLVLGQTSGAKARIKYFRKYDQFGVSILELFLTNITGTFLKNELIYLEDVLLGTNSLDDTVIYDGNFNGTDSFLSSDKKLQDGYYYQEYSYEISSDISRDRYIDVLENLVHPSGTKLFSKMVFDFVVDVVENQFGLELDFYRERDVFVTLNLDGFLEEESEIDIYQEQVIDYPALLDFQSTTYPFVTNDGKVSVFSNTSVAFWADVPVSLMAEVPPAFLGTKRLLNGHPNFATGTPAPTEFLNDVGIGAEIYFKNDTFVNKVNAVYNDYFALLVDPYPGADFFNATFAGSGNFVVNVFISLQEVNSNLIVMDLFNRQYTLFGDSVAENVLFDSYTPSFPFLVPTGEDVNFNIPTGGYEVRYYSDVNETTLLYREDMYLTDPDLYPLAEGAKDATIEKIIFEKYAFVTNASTWEDDGIWLDAVPFDYGDEYLASISSGFLYGFGDLNRMFVLSTGPTAVASPGDSVGLFFDNLTWDHNSLATTMAAQSDLLGGAGSFASSTGWTQSGTASIASGKLSFTGTGRASYVPTLPVNGGMARVSHDTLARSAGDVTFNFADNDAGTDATTPVYGTRTVSTGNILYVQIAAGNLVFRINGVSAYVGEQDNVTVKLVPGNYALQATSGSRGTYQADGILRVATDDGYLTSLKPGKFLMARVKLTGGTGTRVVAGASGSSTAYFNLYFNSSGQAAVQVGSGSEQAFGTDRTGVDGTVGLRIRADNTVDLIIDGVVVNSAAMSGAPTTAQNIAIGATNNNGTLGSFLTGDFITGGFGDSIIAGDVPPTDAEIRALHNRLMATL